MGNHKIVPDKPITLNDAHLAALDRVIEERNKKASPPWTRESFVWVRAQVAIEDFLNEQLANEEFRRQLAAAPKPVEVAHA